MAVSIPGSRLRIRLDRATGVALIASLAIHGAGLYAADRWGECICNFGQVVCPKLCDSARLDVELAALPPPPPPKAQPKPVVVEQPRPQKPTAAPKRGRIVLPDEALAKPEKPKAEITAELPALPREAVVKASEANAPVLVTPSVFARAGDLRPGSPGEFGLGGTGRSMDPRASGTSDTSEEVGETAPPPPKPASPPPPPPRQQERPKGPSRPPRVLDWTDPAYPELARKQGAEGTVVLRLTITADGRPADIRVAASSGRDDLDAAAVARVGRARFSPALKDGERVAMSIRFRVKFRLVNA